MLWLAYVFVATVLDALTDVASDHVIATDEGATESTSRNVTHDEEACLSDDGEEDRQCGVCRQRREQTQAQAEETSVQVTAEPSPAAKRRKHAIGPWARLMVSDAWRIYNTPSSLLSKIRLTAAWAAVSIRRAGLRAKVLLFAGDVLKKSQLPATNLTAGVAKFGCVDKLTSEQDLLCSCVTMFVVSTLIWVWSDWSILPPADPGMASQTYWLSVLAGCLYAHAMQCIMKAWELVPSTIVTPMMQLSGPCVQLVEAGLGTLARRLRRKMPPILESVSHAYLTRWDLLAFVLITGGGLAPSAENLPQLARLSTWRSPAMRLLLMSNVLYSIYYVFNSLCVGDEATATPTGVTELQFIVVSNLAAVIFLLASFATNPHLRQHAFNLRRVKTMPKVVSAVAECTNYISMLLLSCAYQRYHSSGLVTAARTGLNQFTNVFLAALLYKLANVGRPVLQVERKLVSACFVTLGLFVSIEV